MRIGSTQGLARTWCGAVQRHMSTISWALPADDADGTVARQVVQSTLVGHSRLEDIELVVGELASNAFRHGSPPQYLFLDTGPEDTVVARVTQRETVRRPALREDGEDPSGLALIAAVADGWGWSLLDGRLVVWARFD